MPFYSVIIIIVFLFPAISSADNLADQQLARSRTFFKVGQYPAAIDLYQKFLKDHPNDKTVWLELAWTHVKNNEVDKASRIVKALSKREPYDLSLYATLVDILQQGGRADDARKVMDSALARYPGKTDLEAANGKLLLSEGKNDEAVKIFQSILTRNPNHDQAALGLAQGFENQGELKQALKYYRRVLILKHDSEEGIAGYARVTAGLGNLQKATAIYRKGLKQLPYSSELRLGLSEVYEQEQRIDYAIAVLRPLLSGNNQEAYARIERMRSIQWRLDTQNDTDTNHNVNSFTSLAVWFRTNDSNVLEHVKFSHNTFQTPGFEFVQSNRLEFGAEGEFRKWGFKLAGGEDIFSEGSPSPQANGELGWRIVKPLKLSLVSQYERFGSSAETLLHHLTVIRYGSTLLWDLSSKTQVFASQLFGNYTDGNKESQSFIKIQRTFNLPFSIAASYLNWNFASDPQAGYYAPQDFQLASAILGYNGVLLGPLQLSAFASVGFQPKVGLNSPITSWEAKLGTPVGSNLEIGGGLTQTDAAGYNLTSITGYLTGAF